MEIEIIKVQNVKVTVPYHAGLQLRVILAVFLLIRIKTKVHKMKEAEVNFNSIP